MISLIRRFKMRAGKKIITVILAAILFIPGSLIYASGNAAIIPLSSPIYEFVDALYTMEGHAAPQGARPWTEADLRQQLDRITPSSTAAKRLYDIIEEQLSSDNGTAVSADFNLFLTPSMAAHSNNKHFDTSSDWAVDVLNDKLIGAQFSLYVSDYFAGRIGISLGFRDATNSRGINEDGVYRFLDSSDEDRFSSSFATNIPFISNGSIDPDITDNSFISIGNQYISFSLGRGQVSWGNGIMGNLILGNTLPYHDYVSLSASNNSWFDYTMLVSFFSHPMNYYQSFTDEIHGTQMFIGHRFEFRMLWDKLRLTLNEAIMYHSPDDTIDFRAFSPLLILHGLYIPANANSLASAEIEFAPIRNLQLYLSFAVDDLSVGGEPKAPAEDATLNMWGIMGGARAAIPHGNGYFSVNLETVYASPFMYHKDSYNNGSQYNYALDYVGSVRLSNGRYHREYLSFPFGSDAFTIYTGLAYTVPKDWSAGIKLFFMAHGVTDENSIAKKYDGTITAVPGWLATMNPFDPEENGAIEYTYNIGLDGEYYILDNLLLSSSIDFIYAVNFDNMPGNQFDIQWTVTLKYNLF